MSHELRTPLNAILGFSEVMKSEVFGPHAVPTYKEYAGDIHNSGVHLLNLINEILDLSRIEAGRYESIYGNMPRFGLAMAGDHVPAVGAKETAKRRLGLKGEPAVPSYENPARR